MSGECDKCGEHALECHCDNYVCPDPIRSREAVIKVQDKRKSFQHLPGNENPQFLEDGKRIYLELRKKYPNNTDKDLDNILNGLCASLICLVSANVDKSNHKNFLQLIWKILNQNL